jgi:thiamine monophosphate synthase
MTATVPRPSGLRERLAAVPIYLIATCPAQGAGAVLLRASAAARALHERAGHVALQLRCKQASVRDRRELLRQARSLLPPGALLLVNDDLAAVLDEDGAPLADGVHLGREDAAALAPLGTPQAKWLPAGLHAARVYLGEALLIGASTRTRAELRAALEAGADHAGFGAIAPSGTKLDTRPASLAELQQLLAEFPQVPVFPIGGITPSVLAHLAALGARRAAVGSAVLEAADPAAAALACLAALTRG